MFSLLVTFYTLVAYETFVFSIVYIKNSGSKIKKSFISALDTWYDKDATKIRGFHLTSPLYF